MSRYQQRTKTLTVYAPCCGAKMSVEYDGTGDRWERSTDVPAWCPNGHSLTVELAEDYALNDMQEALAAFADKRAINGVGDVTEADLCGYDKAER
jgi:hypothetical protein